MGGHSLLWKGSWPLVSSCILPPAAFLLPGMLVLLLRKVQCQLDGVLFPYEGVYMTR